MWTWIVGSRFGQAVAAVGAAILVLFGAYLKGIAAGKSSEKAKRAEKTIQNLQKRDEIEDEVARTPADDRRRELSEWVRDDK